MIRKTVFLLLVLTGIIPFACCPESPKGPYKVELSQITLLNSNYMRPASDHNDSNFIKPDEAYHGDTLLLSLGFYSLLAYQPVSVSMHASAIALSCDEFPNFTHLQDKIASVQVYSSHPFHEIPAGELITDKVLVYHYKNGQITSLAQAITNMNTLHYSDGMEMGLENLVLPGKPAAESADRTFTVRIGYESGREDAVTSIPVRW